MNYAFVSRDDMPAAPAVDQENVINEEALSQASSATVSVIEPLSANVEHNYFLDRDRPNNTMSP